MTQSSSPMSRTDALRLLVAEVADKPLRFSGDTERALRIRRALDDPDCHVDAAAKLIQAEPLFAAQVVAIANSVAYNPMGREIGDVKTAVARLGFSTLRSMAMAFATRQLAGPAGTPEQRRLATQLWEHTCHVAALCRTLAKRVTNQDAETALFAGLVHEIGGFYLLSRVVEFPALLAPSEDIQADDEAAAESFDIDDEDTRLQAELTLAVLRRLGTPELAYKAVADYWDGFLSMPARTLGDTVLLAESLAPVPSPLLSGEVEGGASIDMTLDESTLSEIMAESAAEVASVVQALRS